MESPLQKDITTTTTTINNITNEEEILKQAEELKNKGNQEYSRNLWEDAYKSYSESIKLLTESSLSKPNKSLTAILYCNRSAVNIQWLKYEEALEDVKQSIINDIEFSKAYLRAGDCCIGLKKFKEAKEYYLQCIFYIKVDPNDKTMNMHNTLLTQATNGLNNSKMKIFYEPILRGNDDFYSKLELRYQDKVREKSLISKVDIKKGDIVFIDLPYAYQISPSTISVNSNIVCYHCMSYIDLNNVAKCHGGCNVQFCSEQCRDESWNQYHIQMCKKESEKDSSIQKYRQMVWSLPTNTSLLLAEKIIARISQSLKQRKAKNCNLGLDNSQHLKRDSLMKQQDSFNGENLKELQAQFDPLIALLKDAYGLKENDMIQYKKDTILQEEFDKLFSNDFYDSILGLINFNVTSTVVKVPDSMNKKLDTNNNNSNNNNKNNKNKNSKSNNNKSTVEPVSKIKDSWGIGLFPIFSCMNHSCQPNVEISNERADGVTFGKVVFKAKKNIKAGQEILHSYCDELLPTKERQLQLKSQYDFICKCNKCH